MEVTFNYLEKELKPRLKNPFTRSEAFKELMGINPTGLEPDALIHLSHLKSRYYFYMFKEYEHIEDLRLAIDYAQKVFDKAREIGKLIKDPLYYYPRVYFKYLLMQQVEDKALQKSMRQKVLFYTEKALYHYPSNSSFIWLKSQL